MTERELIKNYVLKCWDAGSPDEIKEILQDLLINSQPNGGDRVVSENEPQKNICPDCEGTGYINIWNGSYDKIDCGRCSGKGQID